MKNYLYAGLCILLGTLTALITTTSCADGDFVSVFAFALVTVWWCWKAAALIYIDEEEE